MAKFKFSSYPLTTTIGVMALAALVWWRMEPILMHAAAQAIIKSEQVPTVEISRSMTAPNFELRDADGKTVRLSDFRGKVVLLNFWATWCGPCKFEIPWFIEFQNRYKSEGFTVLGVSMDDTGWAAVRPYMAQARMNYPVVLGNETVNAAYGKFEVLPTTVIIGRDGKIEYLHAGLASKDQYREEILTLLRKTHQETETVVGRMSGSPARTN